MAALKFVQSPVAALALPIGSSDTTMYGLNIKDIYGNYLSMTNFGDIGYMTINPTSPFAEIVSFTGCVYQGNGTTKFTGCTRGLLAIDPYTTGGTANAHQANDSIVFSINPQMLDTMVQKGQDASITGTFTFSNAKVPRMNATVVYGIGSDLWLATKEYVDDTAIAGAPNASISTKGIGRVSVSPVDATIPIFVGDNDPRMPTQQQKNALVGQSGTPDTANPYETYDDTSATSVANKLVRMNSDGQLNGGIATSFIQNITAGQDLALNDAVFLTTGAPINEVAYDNSTSQTSQFIAGSYSFSYTCTGSNRLLIVGIGYNGGSVTVTYGGVAMTSFTGPVGAVGNAWFYLVAPASGSNTLAVTAAGTTQRLYTVMSFNNAKQSAPTFGVANTTSSAVAGSIGSKFLALAAGTGGTGSTLTTTATQDNAVAATNNAAPIDANGGMRIALYPTSYGSGNVTATVGGDYTTMKTCAVRIDPVSVSTGLIKSTAATSFSNNSNTFLGIVNAVTTKGNAAPVTLMGIRTTTGLTEASNYYLTNVAGVIGTSAGTVSKRVGYTLSTTQLLLAAQ
jgi:hypothetical protein